MNGTTSVAPMRGCAPVCRVRSISSAALPTARTAASATASGSPASVITLRLWSASLSCASTNTPGTSRIAVTMASTLAGSRPSEKFGTHSTSGFIWEIVAIRVDHDAALHRHLAKIHPKIIGNFAVAGHIKRREVRILANFERADAVVLAERIRRIDRGGGNRFRGRHAHGRAGQRENHGHAESRAGAGIKVRRQPDG